MKKVFNTILIASVLVLSSNFAVAKKVKTSDSELIASKDKEIHIIKTEKEVKVNQKTEIKKLNIFPHYHYIRIDDVILGTYNEHPVQIIEFNLIEKIFERTSKGGHRRHYIEVFKGVLFQTSMEKNVKADILIKNRCSNLHSNILREKINLESNDFEKQFEVYSNDQIEARYFLTTATIDNLLKINNAKQRISGYISGRNVNLLLHSDKDMFEPSIYKELDNPNNYSELIFQAKSILDLITSLKLDSKTGL